MHPVSISSVRCGIRTTFEHVFHILLANNKPKLVSILRSEFNLITDIPNADTIADAITDGLSYEARVEDLDNVKTLLVQEHLFTVPVYINSYWLSGKEVDLRHAIAFEYHNPPVMKQIMENLEIVAKDIALVDYSVAIYMHNFLTFRCRSV